MIGTIGAAMAVIGAACVARDKALLANMIWAISNPLMMIHLYSNSDLTTMSLFGVYELIALYGIWNIRRRTTWNV